MRKILLFGIVLMLGLAACSENDVSVTGVRLNNNTLTLTVGETERLIAAVLPENATNQNVTWHSNNTAVATVNAQGVVNAVSPGTTTITVRTADGGREATATVTVNAAIVSATGVTLSKETLSLVVGDTETLIANVLPAGATNQNVTWHSSDEEFVTVDDDGVVTAEAEGTATITVKTEDGGFTADVEIIVTPAPILVTSVQIDRQRLFLTLGGESVTVSAFVFPRYATNQNVSWEIANTNIATVDDNGLVTAVAVGETTITVTAECGGYTDTIPVEVELATVPVTGVTLNRNALILRIGNDDDLWATVAPFYATNRDVKWATSNPAVASITVDEHGTVLVTAVSVGMATITVTTEDGGFTATSTVEVPDFYDEGVVINGIRWATRNVSLPGTFAPYPESYGMFYQWNRPIGWNSTNPMFNSNRGTMWDNTVPTGTTWYAHNDPCPAGWRMPTRAEFTSLINAGSEEIEKNGARHGRIFGTAPNQIFLPTTGRRSTNGSLTDLARFITLYWSSSVGSGDNAWALDYRWGSNVNTISHNRAQGLPIRCVDIVPVTVPVTGVTLNRNTLELAVGGNATLIHTIIPSNATNQNVEWISTNSSIATVNQNGVVTAVWPGTTFIYVSTDDGYFYARAEVTVITPVTGVTVNRNALTLTVGSDADLWATVAPFYATNQEVRWENSNPAVATMTVNEHGTVTVTAVSVGMATITAITENGGFTARTSVEVPDTTDEGVVINGIRWATRNVSLPGTFAPYPEIFGMYYQWNRRIGWSSHTNPLFNSQGGTIWDSTTPIGTEWEAANDPCPAGWRVPTQAELQSLNNAGSEWITQNRVNGRLFGTAPNQIFLPAAGFRHSNGAPSSSGGNYWSSTRNGPLNVVSLNFLSGMSTINLNSNRVSGFSIRCVAAE